MPVNVTGGDGSLYFDADIDTSNFEAKLTQAEAKLTSFGAIGTKALADLSAQYQSLQAEQSRLQTLLQGTTDPKLIADYNNQLFVTQAQMKGVAATIQAFNPDPIKQVNTHLTDTTTRATTAYTQLRQLKNQLAEMNEKGLSGTPQFEATLNQATELEHSLGNVNRSLELSASNTAGVQAIGEALKGVAGAAEIVQGSLAFFSSDNEQIEKTIKNLTALIAIVQGLNEVGTVLSKESPLNIYLTKLIDTYQALREKSNATKADTTIQQENNEVTEVSADTTAAQAEASEALTIARTEEAAATETATVATTELNVAMDANPAGVLLLALGAIVVAFQAFTADTTTATEEQKKLNEALSQAEEGLIKLSELYKEVYADQTTNAQEALNVAQSQNTSAAKLYELQQKVNDAKKQESIFTLANLGITGQSVEAIQKQVDALHDAAIVHQETLTGLQSNPNPNADLLEKAKRDADDSEKIYVAANNALQGIKSAETDTLSSAAANQKRIQDESLKSAIAYWQARVEAAKEGSKTQAQYSAQLQLNQAEYNQTLNNPNLTSGEKTKAVQDRIDADKDAQIAYKTKVLTDQEDIINAQLDKTRQGSQEELSLKLSQLDKQTQAEILAAKNNASKIEQIQADSLKKQDDLKKQYEQTDVERILELQQNFAKQQLSTLPADSEAYTAYTKESNDITGRQQIEEAIKTAQSQNPLIDPKLVEQSLNISADNVQEFANKVDSIDSNLAQKIRTIWAETTSKNIDADNKLLNTRIENANKLIDLQTSIAKEKNNIVINSQDSTDLDKANAQIANNQIDSTGIQQKLQSLVSNISTQSSQLGKSIKDYIDEVKVDFSKLGDLDNSDSSISKTLAGIKDPAIKQSLTQLLTQLHSVNTEAKDLKNVRFDALVKGIAALGSALSDAGSSISTTNAGLGDTLQTLGSIITIGANLATGIKGITEAIKAAKDAMTAFDIASVVLEAIVLAIQAITAVVNIFTKARQSAKEANQQLLSYQDSLLTGEITYNELLRQRAITQADITKMTVQQLEAQTLLLSSQKQQAEADEQRLLTLIQQQGQQITGEHEKKYGGVLGIGRKTKTVQDLAGLSDTDYNNLEKLFTEGKLDAKTAAWFQELQKVHDELAAIGQSAQDVADQLDQALTGTTADDITNTIIQGFSDGKSAISDFGSDFQTIMKNAILQSLKYSAIEKPVQDLYNELATELQGNDTLSANEITDLQNKYNAIIQNASQQFQQLQQIAGVDFSANGGSANSLQGAIKGITEDTANLLAGQESGIHLLQAQQVNILTEQLNYTIRIASNTDYLPQMTQILDNQRAILRDFQSNGLKIR